MKVKLLLLQAAALVAAMMCAFGAAAVEAYANYTPSNTTLTFYYDGIRGSRTGTTYDLTLPDALWPGWYFDYDMQAAVTKVVFDPSFSSARPQTTYAWFSGMSNLTTITGMKEYLNTSEVTNMNIMFSGCSSLTSLDVSGFNTGNVEYMASMFAYCSSLTSLDLSNFNTSQVQFMNYMFSYCRKLKSVNLSSFNTANVLEMSGLFTECNELASVDLSSFNTAKVTDMHNMFLYCSNLTSLDVSGFNTANVTDMQDMFAVCPNLTTIYVGDEWSTAAVTPSTSMFYRSTSLVGGMGTTYDASHVDATYAHIDGGPSNPGYFTAKTEAYACYTESNTTLTFYCDNQRSSRTDTTYDVNLNQGSSFPAWFTNDVVSNVTKAVFDPSFANARPTSTGGWFFYMSKLKSITGLNFLNTSEVTYMVSMFADCSNLTNLDLSSWNTAKVTDMRHMFRDCSGLTTIYVGDEWSTSAVTQSNNMFYGCTSLVGGQGTTWNDSNPRDKTYAHIDYGTSNPGYFTDKNAALRGDVNGDGSVNISDVTALIDYLLGGDASGINLNAADCTQDGSVNISDVTALIDHLLGGTW